MPTIIKQYMMVKKFEAYTRAEGKEESLGI